MNATRAGVHRYTGQGAANDRRYYPDREIRCEICNGIGHKALLDNGGDQCKDTRSRKRRRTVAAKLRSAGYLFANAADIAERSVKIIHREVTFHCKVIRRGVDVKRERKIFPR